MNLALSKNIWNIVLVSNEFIFQLINSTGVYYRPIPRGINTKWMVVTTGLRTFK